MSSARGWTRVSLAALAVAALLLTAAALAALRWREAVLHGYLAACVLWCGVPLGAGALLLLSRLTGGRWGEALGPAARAALRTTPLLALLCLPLLWGLADLYPWARVPPGVDPLLDHKRPYLNEAAVLLRGGVYLALWIGGALWLTRRGAGSGGAALGLILYVLSVSFAAFDGVVALDAHFHSSVFGLYVVLGQGLLALAALLLLGHLGPGERALDPAVRHDLGNLLLALVVLHAYLGFSQWLIVWSEDLPHEAAWFLPRTRGVWGGLAVALAAGHFALPFLALLSRRAKRDARALSAVAALLVLACGVDAAWLVLPAGADAHPLALLAAASWLAVGMGALLLSAYAWQRGRALRPRAQAAGGGA